MRLSLPTIVVAIAGCAAHSPPRAAPAGTSDAPPAPPMSGYRAVPPSALEREMVDSAMPRLPDEIRRRRASAGELRGAYMVYVARDGHVDRVEVALSIPGADATIVAQLKTWRFKPQPFPVRSLVTLVFSLL